MATTFTNRASLSYGGNTVISNTVTGEIAEVLGVTKTAVTDEYRPGEPVTYIVTLTNSGACGTFGADFDRQSRSIHVQRNNACSADL